MALVADYDTGNVRLDLDCLPSKEDPLARKNRSPYISIPQDALVYFAQEPGRKKKFLVSINSFLTNPNRLTQFSFHLQKLISFKDDNISHSV